MILSKILCGATRRVMTGKHGNKNFYKGNIYYIFMRCAQYIVQFKLIFHSWKVLFSMLEAFFHLCILKTIMYCFICILCIFAFVK